MSNIPWNLLKQNNVDLKIIGCSKPTAISSFSKDTGFPVENIFVDYPRECYNRFGLYRVKKTMELMSERRHSKDTKTNVLFGLAYVFSSYLKRGT